MHSPRERTGAVEKAEQSLFFSFNFNNRFRGAKCRSHTSECASRASRTAALRRDFQQSEAPPLAGLLKIIFNGKICSPRALPVETARREPATAPNLVSAR